MVSIAPLENTPRNSLLLRLVVVTVRSPAASHQRLSSAIRKLRPHRTHLQPQQLRQLLQKPQTLSADPVITQVQRH
jgi:hypothetical protein